MGDLKEDVRTLRGKMDALRDRMDAKFDAVNAALSSMNGALNGMKDSIKAEIAAAKIWALLLYFALAAGMLGTMARGFGWI